jgi:hypothetical protein
MTFLRASATACSAWASWRSIREADAWAVASEVWLVAFAPIARFSYAFDRNPETPATLAAMSVSPTPASAKRRIFGTARRWSMANEVSLPASNRSPIAPTTISAPGTSFIMPKVATPPEKQASAIAVL